MDDLSSLFAGLSDEQILEMLTPYLQQQGVLEQQMALGTQTRQPTDGQHVSPWGAALGGLSDAINNVHGAYQQRKALEGQQTLNSKMQGDAANRVKLAQQQERQRALEDFLRNRTEGLGLNNGITDWGI